MRIFKLLLASCLLCSAFFNNIFAQNSIEQAMAKTHPECRDVFLNAIDLIPQYYKTHEFDSLQKVIDIWKASCNGINEIKYTEILMSIERSTFNNTQINDTLIQLLISYSYSNKYSIIYNDNNPNGAYYRLSNTWAKLLLAKPGLDRTETFICNVFAGNIQDPLKEIYAHKADYDTLYALVNKEIAEQKKQNSADYTIMTGIWAPLNKASVLGVHPSFGVQFGGRFHNHHQLDLTLQFRFIKSAGMYTVKRDTGYYDLNHYFGGYFGIDYTYYFITRNKTDFGLMAGIGYDGFDIANSDNNHNNDYLKPLSISSFNFNTGLRFNYAFNPSTYLGLQGRYNFINYNTKGGSNLSGNAFSIDLILGFTMRQTRLNYY